MTTLSLDDIEKAVDKLALKIKAPSDLLPTYGYLRDFAYPHIELDDTRLLHYVIMERGQELEWKTTNKLDDLLYWIFSSVTFSMACTYQLKNRVEDKDSRRIIFKKQEKLPGTVSEAWRQKEQEEHKQILKKHVFDDLAGLRATCCGQLRQQGYSEREIDTMAYKKYPSN